MAQARGDSIPILTANRETVIHSTSKQEEFASMVEIGQIYITNESVIDGNSSTLECGK